MILQRSKRVSALLVAAACTTLAPSAFAHAPSAAVNLDDAAAPPLASKQARATTAALTPTPAITSAPASRTAPSAPASVVSPAPTPGQGASKSRHAQSASGHSHEELPKRDELDPSLGISVKDAPPPAADLPGVLKLDGTAVGLLDPARARSVSCSNEGSATVYLSVTEPNRIQLPFPNPHVISTTDLEISKRANNNNIYVTFAAGVSHPATLWLEPQEGSSVACGLQVIPKRIPAQSIHVVDDSGATTQKSARAEEGSDFLSRVQADLEDALEGRAPAGWSSVNIPVPPIAIDGVLIEGVRRLSSLREDIYVYTVVNPGPNDVVLEETEFDGPTVEAVSILPTPLLHARGTTRVAVLARKSPVPTQAGQAQVAAGGR